MSRHEFQRPGVQVAIGWDAPLATFYLQVWSEALVTAEMDEADRASPQIWHGMEYGEFPEPSWLVALAARHFPELPDDMEERLRREKEQNPARPRSIHHDRLVRELGALIEEASAESGRRSGRAM